MPAPLLHLLHPFRGEQGGAVGSMSCHLQRRGGAVGPETEYSSVALANFARLTSSGRADAR